MEELELQLEVNLSPDEAFQRTRDHLSRIITAPEPVYHDEVDRQTKNDDVVMRNDRWKLDVLEPIPDFIGSQLTFESVQVRSETLWIRKELKTEWSVQVPNAEDFLTHCEGVVYFEDRNSHTNIEVKGEFETDISVIPGISNSLSHSLQTVQAPLAKKVILVYLPVLRNKLEEIKESSGT